MKNNTRNKIELSKLKMNERINTNDILPGFEDVAGKQIKLVGVSYHFVTDTDLFQSINIWAKGFNRDDYE